MAEKRPRVILGLMTIGPDVAQGGRISNLDEFNKILDSFQARGYNEVDTAGSYVGGTQEGFTKEAHWQERGLKLATKCYPNPYGNHKAEIITQKLEQSLQRLGSESVDIFYLHAADRSVPFVETLEALDKLHKAGKFRQLGLSNFTAYEVAEIVITCKYNNWVRPTIYQGLYNCITRSLDTELIAACHRYGLDVVVYGPIAGGLFSGAIKSKDDVPDEGRFSDKWYGGSSRARYWRDSVFEAVQRISAAADKHGITMIEVALRWVVHHSKLNIKDGGNDGVIIGISKLAHLGSNLDACEQGPLPDDVLEAVEHAHLIAKAESVNYWHGELKYTYDPQEVLFGPGAK